MLDVATKVFRLGCIIGNAVEIPDVVSAAHGFDRPIPT